jgi:sugar phosphate isomerase/epimerase
VSINGVDVANQKYIRTLDEGDFDLKGFLAELKRTGYRGPVGLQCYSLTGDIRDNLRKSIEAWRKLQPAD